MNRAELERLYRRACLAVDGLSMAPGRRAADLRAAIAALRAIATIATADADALTQELSPAVATAPKSAVGGG